jgi:glycosyltransferase involved in cell wall biosynthesis
LDAHLPIIVFVGRLIREKRIEVLIQACLPLVDRCQLLIVGDGPARTELEALATIRSPQIRFAGHQTGESLAHCFIGSDIFALPGAGGLAIHQAMSYGKPVIVSFGDGTEQDLVVEGENGLFFKTADSDDLAQKISCLLDYPVDRIAAMGQRSLEIVRTKRSLTTMVEVFEAAFEAVTRNGQVLPEMSRE